MALSSPKLKWCIVRLGEDMNWWVHEISDEIHWDVDALSILDPRQIAYIIDLVDPLRDYGFSPDILEAAFYPFAIEQDLGNSRVKLKRTSESLLESEEHLFALPDVVDEEKGPYADFLDHITKLRLKMLNDLIDFEQHLTVEELEEELRERYNNDFMEGKATHVFEEITNILEYVPEGYEVDDDEVPAREADEDKVEEDFPDLEDESIEEDETMRWDDEEELVEEEEEEEEDIDFNEDDEDEEDEEEGEEDEGKSDK